MSHSYLLQFKKAGEPRVGFDPSTPGSGVIVSHQWAQIYTHIWHGEQPSTQARQAAAHACALHSLKFDALGLIQLRNTPSATRIALFPQSVQFDGPLPGLGTCAINGSVNKVKTKAINRIRFITHLL